MGSNSWTVILQLEVILQLVLSDQEGLLLSCCTACVVKSQFSTKLDFCSHLSQNNVW